MYFRNKKPSRFVFLNFRISRFVLCMCPLRSSVLTTRVDQSDHLSFTCQARVYTVLPVQDITQNICYFNIHLSAYFLAKYFRYGRITSTALATLQ